MMPVLAIALLVFVPWLAGHAVGMGGGHAARWVLGVVIVSGSASLLFAIGVPWLWALAMPVATCVSTAGWRAKGAGGDSRWRHSPWLALALGIVGLALGVITVASPVDLWDAVAIWYPKARAILDGLPLALVPHRDYPNAGAIAWASLLGLAGTGAESVTRLLFPMLYVAWTFALTDIFSGPVRGALAAVVFAAAVTAATLAPITSGYQDIVLMSVAGVAAVLFLRTLRADRDFAHDPRAATPALVVTAGLGLIKSEGLFLAAALLIGWLTALRHERSEALTTPRSKWVVAIAGAAVFAWPLVLWWNGMSLLEGQDATFESISARTALSRLDRLPHIVSFMIHLSPTLTFPFAAAGLLSMTAWANAPSVRPRLLLLWISLALYLAWIAGVFMLTNVDLDWHLRTAMPRLFNQLGFAWTSATVVAAAGLLRRERTPVRL